MALSIPTGVAFGWEAWQSAQLLSIQAHPVLVVGAAGAYAVYTLVVAADAGSALEALKVFLQGIKADICMVMDSLVAAFAKKGERDDLCRQHDCMTPDGMNLELTRKWNEYLQIQTEYDILATANMLSRARGMSAIHVRVKRVKQTSGEFRLRVRTESQRITEAISQRFPESTLKKSASPGADEEEQFLAATYIEESQ